MWPPEMYPEPRNNSVAFDGASQTSIPGPLGRLHRRDPWELDARPIDVLP